MHRITSPTAVPDLFGPGKPGFTDGDPLGSIPPTFLNALWFNAVQEEILNVVEAAGIVPDVAKRDQLLEALGGLVRTGAWGYAVAGGTANAITANLSPALLAYTDGLVLRIKPTAANSGAATLNVNGRGARSIRKLAPGEAALSAGDINATGAFMVMYLSFLNGGAGGFLLIDPALVAAARVAGVLAATNIPNLDASKTTTGVFELARIPDFNAEKATSGTLADARLSVNVARRNAANQFVPNQRITGNGANSSLFIERDDGATMRLFTTEAVGGLRTDGEHALVLGTNSASRMTIAAAGQITAHTDVLFQGHVNLERNGINPLLRVNRTDGATADVSTVAGLGVFRTTGEFNLALQRASITRIQLEGSYTRFYNGDVVADTVASHFGRVGFSNTTRGTTITSDGDIDNASPLGVAGLSLRKSGATGNFIHLMANGTTQVGSASTNGSSVSWNTTSDGLMKDLIGKYNRMLAVAMIRADPVVDFYWKHNGMYAVGWIAQDSFQVSEDLASPGGWKDPITGEEWEEGGVRWVDPVTYEPWEEDGVRWLDPETGEAWEEDGVRFFCDQLGLPSEGPVLWANPETGQQWYEGGVNLFDPRTGGITDAEFFWIDPVTHADWEEGAFRYVHPETGAPVDSAVLWIDAEGAAVEEDTEGAFRVLAVKVEAVKLLAGKVEAAPYDCRRIDAVGIVALKVEAFYVAWGMDQSKRTPYLWAAAEYLLDERDAMREQIDQLTSTLASVLLRLDALEAR